MPLYNYYNCPMHYTPLPRDRTLIYLLRSLLQPQRALNAQAEAHRSRIQA